MHCASSVVALESYARTVMQVEHAIKRAPLADRKRKRTDGPVDAAPAEPAQHAQVSPPAATVQKSATAFQPPKKPRTASIDRAAAQSTRTGTDKHRLACTVALGNLSSATKDAAIMAARAAGKVHTVQREGQRRKRSSCFDPHRTRAGLLLRRLSALLILRPLPGSMWQSLGMMDVLATLFSANTTRCESTPACCRDCELHAVHELLSMPSRMLSIAICVMTGQERYGGRGAAAWVAT